MPADTRGVYRSSFALPHDVLVSVVILSLNGGEMLRTLFASIRKCNTWSRLEFIVVDHGGDELTERVLEEAAAIFDVRHLKPGRNFSFSFSCNRGAQVAQGDIVLFLNNDIEFTEDVLPEMVAAVQATNGLVGLKLWQKDANGQLAAQPQIGVRFRWNLMQRWTVPYEAIPGARDEMRAVRPSIMPVVTGAILACHRASFLEIGGFSDEYLYAYEDVDLGLKAAAHNMPSLSLNHLSAMHLVGATRFKRARRERRRRWHRYNLNVFRTRCGYRSRRLAGNGLFGGEGFDWGRKPALALVTSRCEEDIESSAACGDVFDFVDVKADGFFGRNLYGYDLIISRLPAFDFSRARHLSPMAVKVGWAREGEDWNRHANSYDLLLADSPALANDLSLALERPVSVLTAEEWPLAVTALVRDFLAHHHRIAVVASSIDDGRASHLASRLRARGYAVRLEAVASYPSRESMRDDLAVWLAPPVVATLPPDTCHAMAFDKHAGGASVSDLRLGSWDEDFDSWFELLVAEFEGYHAARMSGPMDVPLATFELADDRDAYLFWNEYDDPTEWLIGVP